MKQTREPHPVIAKIQPEIEQTLADYGFELVRISYGGRGKNRTLSIFMDKPGGVTATDCEHMGGQISVLLDAIDPIPDAYQLIVSSPGVERPLTRDSDFQRFAGRSAAVTYWVDDAKHTSEGVLKGIDSGMLNFEIHGKVMQISLDEVEAAHLLYEFDEQL